MVDSVLCRSSVNTVQTSCLTLRPPDLQVAVIMAKLFESIGKLGLALAVGGGVVNSALFNGECWSQVHDYRIELNKVYSS